ncbi:MAG TPA: transcriptional regulator, partial [Kiloniellaceae bacterium]|nr:transcriptional regulator [Kiloniellaceae bacterium]
MESAAAIKSLAALAQATRLDAFPILVREGPEGLAAGVLAARLGVQPATLS